MESISHQPVSTIDTEQYKTSAAEQQNYTSAKNMNSLL